MGKPQSTEYLDYYINAQPVISEEGETKSRYVITRLRPDYTYIPSEFIYDTDKDAIDGAKLFLDEKKRKREEDARQRGGDGRTSGPPN